MEEDKRPSNSSYEQALELEKKLRTLSNGDARATRDKLKDLYRDVILDSPQIAVERDAEQRLWKNVFYKTIEEYRKQLRSQHGSQKSKHIDLKRVANSFLSFLDSANTFYERLLADFAEKYHLKASRASLNAGPSETILYAQCFRILICLGDISRYRRDVPGGNASGEWKRAKQYYEQAHALVPENGNAHNQLAVLRTYCDDEEAVFSVIPIFRLWLLGALYHYFRSMSVVQPFVTAKDNVKVLLEKARSKAKDKARLSTGTSNWASSFVLLQSHLFFGDFGEFDLKRDGVVRSFKSVLESAPPAVLSDWHTDSDIFIQSLLCSIFFIHHAFDQTLLISPIDSSGNLSSRSFGLLASIFACIVDHLIGTGAAVLAPVCFVVTWLALNAALMASIPIESRALSEIRKSLTLLLQFTSDVPPSESTRALPEDFALRGFVPLGKLHTSLDFAEATVTDDGTIISTRMSRLRSSLEKLAHVTWGNSVLLEPAQIQVQEPRELQKLLSVSLAQHIISSEIRSPNSSLKDNISADSQVTKSGKYISAGDQNRTSSSWSLSSPKGQPNSARNSESPVGPDIYNASFERQHQSIAYFTQLTVPSCDSPSKTAFIRSNGSAAGFLSTPLFVSAATDGMASTVQSSSVSSNPFVS